MNAQAKVEKAKKDTGIINIHGKEYQSVALRVSRFRDTHPDWSLTTGIMCRDPECVVMQATIADDQGRILATGHAEEYRKASQINRTSALENAETSAIGRALAALGFGGTEFATANEVANAIHQQGNPATSEEPAAKREKLDGPYPSFTALKGAIKALAATLENIGDTDEMNALMETKDFIALEKQASRDLASWWETGDGLPEEFVPMIVRIERKKKALAEAETAGNYINAG
jgi:hypothetical protein